MQQVWKYGLSLLFLSTCSILDIRKKAIPGYIFMLFGTMGLVLQIIFKSEIRSILIALLPGIAILGVGWVTKEQIGYGDGITILILGLFLSGKESLEIFLFGICIGAYYSILLFFLNKFFQKKRFAFVPCLLLSLLLKIWEG